MVSSGEEAANSLDQFGLIIDCAGVVPDHPKKVVIKPTGKTNHTWSVENLDRIVSLIDKKWREGDDVLVCCARGVSRSVTAAAAYLLFVGEATTIQSAIDTCRNPTRKPSSHSIRGLKLWWHERHTGDLFGT